MKDLLKKSLYTGLGLALATKDKIDEIVEDVKKEADLSEKEGEVLYEKLKEKSESYKTEAENFVEKIVNSTLEALNIPTREEVDAIKARLDKIESNDCCAPNECSEAEKEECFYDETSVNDEKDIIIEDKLEPNEN